MDTEAESSSSLIKHIPIQWLLTKMFEGKDNSKIIDKIVKTRLSSLK